MVESDLYIKSAGYVGPFQMDNAACTAFLKEMKKNEKFAKYIKGTGRAGYMDFVKSYPDKEALLDAIEEYALSPKGYSDNRPSPANQLAELLARYYNLTDENNIPNTTRLPLHAIASLPTGVIARGNGSSFKDYIPQMTENNSDIYYKKWIKDPGNGVSAYNMLKEIDYLTPEIIAQYQTLELTGADNLQQRYNALVAEREQSRALLRAEAKIKGLPLPPPVMPDFEAEVAERAAKLEAYLNELKDKKKTKNKSQNKGNAPVIIAREQSGR